MAAAMEAIPVLAGTQDTGFSFSIHTGDLVSHDPANQLDRYVRNVQVQKHSLDLTELQSIHAVYRGTNSLNYGSPTSAPY